MDKRINIDAEREAVARAICAACGDVPDQIGDARGNAFRWQDYLSVADAALAASATPPATGATDLPPLPEPVRGERRRVELPNKDHGDSVYGDWYPLFPIDGSWEEAVLRMSYYHGDEAVPLRYETRLLYTAEQYQQGQRDAIAHYQRKQASQYPAGVCGIPTWQERYEEDGHAQGGEFYMTAEIADLRAQLASAEANLRTAVQEAWKANAALSALRGGQEGEQPNNGGNNE
jgi:hypothetical protein